MHCGEIPPWRTCAGHQKEYMYPCSIAVPVFLLQGTLLQSTEPLIAPRLSFDCCFGRRRLSLDCCFGRRHAREPADSLNGRLFLDCFRSIGILRGELSALCHGMVRR